MLTTKVSLNLVGGQQEIQLSMDHYAAAAEAGQTLAQYVNNQYETPAGGPNAFDQCLIQTKLALNEDRHFGIRPPTLHEVFTGNSRLASGVIVSPDGTDRLTPAGRYFFPAVLIESMELALRDNREGYNAQFMSMVAETRSIASQKYEQVLIDYGPVREQRAGVIGQLAEPKRLLTISTSQKTRTIPVMSVGIEISKEAQRNATLDLVAIAFRENGLTERSYQLDNDFMNIVNGDVDSGEVGILTGAPEAVDYDATISVAGTLTQKAWIYFLRTNYRNTNLTHIVCDIPTYLAIEGRSGRPTRNDESAQDERLNLIPRVINPGLPNGIQIFIMEDFLANTIVGIDASKALRRVVFSGAEYSAIEEFVMRKSTAMRVDWSELLTSTGYPNAFKPMTLTV